MEAPAIQENIQENTASGQEAAATMLDLLLLVLGHLKLLVIGPLAVALLAFGVTFVVTPVFTASTTFLPPQQQQSAAASALASLGALSGLVGSAGGLKNPGEQYISLMQSVSISDRVIDAFGLMKVYDAKYRVEARRALSKNVRITLGKKDGLITVEVDDESAQRAADIANRYVEELRHITSELALTEAQQRRLFFESQLKGTRDRLRAAQLALQSSGFNPGALRAEPKAAAEAYARLKAEQTAAEVRLQTLRRNYADTTSEVQQQETLLAALRAQVARQETSIEVPREADYVGKYREFKYQETLFELFSRQYELARLDESREGALIQVVDAAAAPERRSRPKRTIVTLIAGTAAAVLLLLFVFARHAWREATQRPEAAERLSRLRLALRRR